MRVALMHHPKTGGTSLHAILKQHFASDRICPERFNDFTRFTDEEMERYQFFSAHMDFSNLQKIAKKTTYTITILREPKERILSLYYYWKAQTDEHIERHNLAGPRWAKKLSLLEFLQKNSDGLPANYNNVYTRNLIGRNWTGSRGEILIHDEEALRVAMRNLMLLDEIGFTDDMPSLVRRVSKKLSIAEPDEIPHERSFNKFGRDDPNTVSLEKEEITSEIDERLDELVRLDKPLYESARLLYKGE